jgi:MoaA/NifB/PqqE/SkfB family radical SAM enzyme
VDVMIERISLEVTNRCTKACSFCYAQSHPAGSTAWDVASIVAFVSDCAGHDVRAVSFGGGEPLQFDGLFAVLERLDGVLFRSFTTNGLLLDKVWDDVVRSRPDKVHVSIHAPHDAREIARVIRQVVDLQDAGVRSGINLVVARSALDHARRAAQAIAAAGIDNGRVMFLPMRGRDTPLPSEIAAMAGGPFQSMTCLLGCAKSERFASIAWDRTVAWCSYTTSRRPLVTADHVGLMNALDGLDLAFCGDA